ncbi:hypothetical protein SCLCIDRAFT_32081 [Scleroderma citrinum Foug A]|uniref:Uncharacterized protein n=1 Tax=Scleroderma citrinum Foug A TaxID=1036808 RepID=A0A0C3DAU9_9AGAM|nr:hypothetical protein SCLCIDRAFT_32081 [Scleroderma citrinum Foug A]
MVRQNVITEQMLTEINDALERFHRYREVFRNSGVINSFSLPWQHSMKHYNYLIRQFGAPNGLCSLITESKHIKAVKWPYRRMNRFQALGQMLLINQRLDKLAAACADFTERGMLNGTSLSHALENIEEPTDQTQDRHHRTGEGDDVPGQVEEQAGNGEEDLGDAVDTPRIDAHCILECNPFYAAIFTLSSIPLIPAIQMISLLMSACFMMARSMFTTQLV